MSARIIDCHCHVYPDAIAKKAVHAVEAFYDGVTGTALNGTVEELLKTGSDAGISHFVVFSVATAPSQVDPINRFIADCVDRSGGRMTGLGTLHQDTEDRQAAVDRAAALGLKGIKLHPDIQRFPADAPWMMDVCAALEGRMCLYLHAGDNRFDFSGPDRIAHIAESFPRLTVVAAHLGGWSVWQEAVGRLAPLSNVMVDCSSSLYTLPPDEARRIIRRYGSHRVLFGTDYPLWTPKKEIIRLLGLSLNDTELENIFHLNAEALFGIPGEPG